MDDKTLEAVTVELQGVLPGRKFGKIFPLSRRSFALDLRLAESRYLFVAAEPGNPRLYLIQRRLKELEQSSENPHPFHLFLRKRLGSSTILAVDKLPNERVVSVRFTGSNDVGEPIVSILLFQLTGKSSNVFVLDDREYILSSLVEKDTDGQRIGEKYSPPLRPKSQKAEDPSRDVIGPLGASVSAALDQKYQQLAEENRFKSRAENERQAIQREQAKRHKLIRKLRTDLESHGDAEKWKRYGDLILANLSNAKRKGDKVVVTDYFQEEVPEIEIEVDADIPLTDAAQKYFRRYTKAQNAAIEIAKRIRAIEVELASLDKKQAELERAIADRDETYFVQPEKSKTFKSKKEKPKFSGTRQFMSSDGFQILVGKRAVDNDQLTFHIAGPVDLWLHAADYSGSHVVVRNPNRKEIPHRTLIEAAQLAAFYSSGKSQPKAAVNYTQKKFVNKPRGVPAGLVRLASFKTIMVEPSIPEALDQKTKI